MKLENINGWLTLIANFGVVAGLVFLGVEVRQNTTALQAAAIQESTSVARQQILTLATDGELNRLTMAAFGDLSLEDQQRVFWLSRSFWLGMQGLYRQWELGVLPSAEWSVWHGIICNNYAPADGIYTASGGDELWSRNVDSLLPDFVSLVEDSCAAPADAIR